MFKCNKKWSEKVRKRFLFFFFLLTMLAWNDSVWTKPHFLLEKYCWKCFNFFLLESSRCLQVQRKQQSGQIRCLLEVSNLIFSSNWSCFFHEKWSIIKEDWKVGDSSSHTYTVVRVQHPLVQSCYTRILRLWQSGHRICSWLWFPKPISCYCSEFNSLLMQLQKNKHISIYI